MIDLRIDSAEKARDLFEAGWPTVAVSLVGKTLRFKLRKYGDWHLTLVFDDSEIVDPEGWVAPTQWHIQHVFRHTANLPSGTRLLVHCQAGASRSPAMAIGILIQNGMTPQAAFDRVKEIRPAMIPNRLMIQYIDDELKLGGELVEIVRKQYEGFIIKGVRLPNRGGFIY